jgi:hypothetical protein
MPRTTVQFNQKYFDQIGKSAGVERLTEKGANAVLAEAKAGAPVDTEDYKNGLHIEKEQARYRTVYRVVGDDWKTLLVEAVTGNLARALKQVARRG